MWNKVTVALFFCVTACGQSSLTHAVSPDDGVMPQQPLSTQPLPPNASANQAASTTSFLTWLEDNGFIVLSEDKSDGKHPVIEKHQQESLALCAQSRLGIVGRPLSELGERLVYLEDRWISQVEAALNTCYSSMAPGKVLSRLKPFLRVKDTKIIFWPTSLHSLSIYEGEITSYDEALIKFQPAAFVPLNTTCSDGRCLKSPLISSQCTNCDKLVSGRTYTVFFITHPSLLSKNVTKSTLSW